jgi:NADH:ubiquinone oxidoreductase subunit H
VVLIYLIWLSLCSLFFVSGGLVTPADGGDFDIFFFLGYALISTLFLYFLVVATQSKYAVVAAARLLVVTLSLDVFFALCFLFFCGHAGGYTFDDAVGADFLLTPVCALPPLALVFFLYVLYEAKRAPFDNAEAESELVGGHLVEFGGRVLLCLYAAEYCHLFFAVYIVGIFVFGGVWGVSLLP